MANTKSKTLELVIATAKKYPTTGNRTLARLLAEQYPHAFKNIEVARSAVRAARGAKGVKHRKEIADKSAIQPLRKHCTLEIPEGIRQTKEPMVFNKPGKWLFISDPHVPYHDKKALTTALEHGVKHGCKNIYINGDFLDFYKISRFESSPEYRNPDEEIEIAIPILEQIARHFKGQRVFKVGNHDARFEMYLAQKAPAVVGIKAFQLDKVLELDRLGFQYVSSKQWSVVGGLAVLHGHEFPRGLTDPVNVGRGVYNRLGDGGLVGHWHKTSRHVETSGLKRRMTVAHSTGCLCDVRPEYCPMTRWNHGFAELETDGKEYHLRNFIIEGNRVYE